MAKSTDPSNKRRDQRYPTKLLIRYRDRRNLKGEFIRNVSLGGIFIQTEDPLPVGEAVALTMVADTGESEQVDGKVVWSNKKGPVDTHGMGVRFFPDADDGKEKLEEFIRRTSGGTDSDDEKTNANS